MLVRALSTALLVVLAACSSTPPPAEPDPALDDASTGDAVAPASSAEVEQAIAHVRAERYAEAIPFLEAALGKDARNAQAHYYLGVSLEGTGKKPEAEQHYREALAADPGLVEASQNLAALQLDEPPRPDEAITVLRAALAKSPGHPKLLHNLGYALSLTGDVEGAAKAYEESIAKEDSPTARFALGTLLFDAKKHDAAVPHLRKAAEASADDPAVLATIARMMGHAGAFGDCVKLLDQAIARKGDIAELWVRRGICKHELGDEPGASKDFEGAIGVDPKFAAAHYYLGVSLAAQKKKPDAKKALQKASELGKGTPIGKQADDRLKSL